MSEETEATSVQGFKKQTQGSLKDLPSGNKARIKAPGMQVFLKKGMIPDSLTPMVQKALKTKKEPKQEDLASILSDPEKLSEALELFDVVVIECWTSPKVLPQPDYEDDRDPNKLYIDEIEFNDKVFTFQFAVGGVTDLQTFRQQQEEMLERLPAS